MKTEELYNKVFGDNAQCYHHPELKKLVQLCMTEYASQAIDRCAEKATAEINRKGWWSVNKDSILSVKDELK